MITGNPVAVAGGSMPEDSHAKAHQAIGAYFSAFSALERELGEAIKVVFRLQGHEAADAIAAALEMAKKIDLVWTAVLLARNVDDSETTREWKEKAAATMSAIHGYNTERNALAHSHLEPAADGSVVFARLQNRSGELKGKGEPNKWSQADFANKIAQLSEVTKRLEQMKSDLLRFTVPLSGLGWLNDVHQVYYRPQQMQMRNVALLDSVGVVSPPPAPEVGTKPKG